jgi:hypothetical protein
MRSAKRSPSPSSTTSVAVAAGRPAVSRGNFWVDAVIAVSFAGFGRGASPLQPTKALEDRSRRLVVVGRPYAGQASKCKARHPGSMGAPSSIG